MASPSSSAIEWENRPRCRCKGCTIAYQRGRDDAAAELEKFRAEVDANEGSPNDEELWDIVIAIVRGKK